MSTMYFVKDGPRPENSGPGYRIDLRDLYARLQEMSVMYLGEEPPEFNTGSPSKYPVRVVVEVKKGQVDSSKFNRPGFYLLRDVAPDDKRLEGIAKTLDI